MILAAIDVGSNAARLLIKEVKKTSDSVDFVKLNMLRIPLRLGLDVFSQGKINQEREKMIYDTMSIFSSLMKIYKVEDYRACATSAMRDALNGKEIMENIKKNTGIALEIISGDEEATLVFENHIEKFLGEDKNFLYIDVGGGSTELAFYEEGILSYRKSFNIGTLRPLECFSEFEEVKKAIEKNINPQKKYQAIGSGGNINKVFSLSKIKDGKPISRQYLQDFFKEIQPLSLQERMRKYKIREDRADVMSPALEIYINILQWAGIEEIFVPKISIADGLIKQLYDKKVASEKN